MRKEANKVDPIPDEFSSYEEAAEFWDTHDTTDYPDAFEDQPSSSKSIFAKDTMKSRSRKT